MMIVTIRNASHQPFLHEEHLEKPKVLTIQTEFGADWLAILPRIWEVPDLNLGPQSFVVFPSLRV
jgi:hypothetical protein